MQKKYTVRLLRKAKIAKDTWLFAFEKPQEYRFLAGQYQTVFLLLPNGNIDSRDMTIASSPFAKELWIVTKIEKNHSVFKDVLLHLSIGSSVELQGPAGGFIFHGEDTRSRVFLAGGIGITVFHSLIFEAAEKHLQIPVTLFASFAKKEDILFSDEFQNIQNEYIKVIYTLTQDEWQGEKGRISESVIKKYIKNLDSHIYMIAGGQDMVNEMNELLLNSGVPQESIKIDYFTGY